MASQSIEPISEPHAAPDGTHAHVSGEDYKPFIASEASVTELTVRALIIGSILGVVFAASSVYLGLKVGLTVSASIPVAVLSITLFRWLAKALKLKPASILENNIVQTVGSAGESLAAGVAFTLPSLLIMGGDLEASRIMLVAMLGGLIGVLMMIPLRHGLIVKEHGKLSYPEGTACADVLIVGEQGGTQAKMVFVGFFIGLVYSILNLVNRLWADVSSFSVGFWGRLKGGTLAFEVSPPMLGVGYIIGPRVASNMMAGGVLAFMVLVPLIHLFGDGLLTPLYPEAATLIRDMSPYKIRNTYILYIGAGAVATSGFVALARSIPTIGSAFKSGLASLRASRDGGQNQVKRTERDLPMTLVLGGSLALILAIWLAPVLEINFATALLILLFGFFFTTVSSRITGEIGSSSNPISGMTVATLLITCGLFVLAGWTGAGYKPMALTTAALVCVAASNGGTISQDLKTGFLIGATPKYQQIAIGVGVITSAIMIGFVLLLLNQGHTTYKPVAFADTHVDVTGDKMANGPDGKSYHVHYVKEDIGEALRGKYLVDDSGTLQFLVDPGVCGTYPFRLDAKTVAGALSIPADAPTELGIDHQAYKVVDLKEPAGGVAAGRYLVDEAGAVHYSATDLWKFDAPKAQLFRLIIDGTLGGKLPWGLVLIGVFFSILCELLGLGNASLAFAVGVYLPISTSAGIFAGGIVRWLVDMRRRKMSGGGASAAEEEFSPGVLMASGLIAGGAIAGVIQSVITFYEGDDLFDFSALLGSLAKGNHSWWPMIPFVVMAIALYWIGTRKEKA